jgi:phosphopantothenoylcysteine decarboxylase/phosphopantothenate--cysteine ligase
VGFAALKGRRIVLGVSGGIAAYKSAELTRLLVKDGAEVHVVMTEAASRFVTPLTLQTLSQHPVLTDLFDLGQESQIGHIRVADLAELIVIAPATADVIARLSSGMADEPLATVVLASRAPVLLAPAMNVNMWENPITQANLRRLDEVGGGRFRPVGPGAGFLACGWTGPGRMADPANIVAAAARLLSPQDLAGLRVLVTAAGTREPLDPVRFLGNRSSGRMGYALARAAALRGADVTLVSGPADLETPPFVRRVDVGTAREMDAAVQSEEGTADVIVMAAAVADYRPRESLGTKLKKEAAGAEPQLALVRNPDILAGLGERRRGTRPILVGFAAETGDPVAEARRKLQAKHCDLVCANDVTAAGAGFEGDTNVLTLVDAKGEERLPILSKDLAADRVIDRIVALWKRASGAEPVAR